MTTYKEWYDRIDNLLTLQDALQVNPISTSFSRRELIELKLIISTCMTLAEAHYEEELKHG